MPGLVGGEIHYQGALAGDSSRISRAPPRGSLIWKDLRYWSDG